MARGIKVFCEALLILLVGTEQCSVPTEDLGTRVFDFL